MKRNGWFLIMMIIFLQACDDFEPKHEAPSIDKEKMAQISADLHIIEAYLQNSPATTRDSLKSLLYYQLYEIHDLDSTELFENQKLYYQNPSEIEALYGRVLEILEEREKELDY